MSFALQRPCKVPWFCGPANVIWRRAPECCGIGIRIQRVQTWLRASSDSFPWTGLGLLSYNTGLEMEDYLILKALSCQWAKMNSWRQQAGLQRCWPIGQGYKLMEGSDLHRQGMTTGLMALCFPFCSPLISGGWYKMSCSPRSSEICEWHVKTCSWQLSNSLPYLLWHFVFSPPF